MQIPWLLYQKFQKNRYDRLKHEKLKVFEGNGSRTKNIVVLLIYQPGGILPSTLTQLRYFDAKGYSTLIVSNAAISEETIKLLSPFAFQIMIRPNFGYDFGGYRDGILHCIEKGIQIESLVVLNDSIWFPAHKDSDPIKDLDQCPSDLVGLTYYTHKSKEHLNHLQSYCFRFGASILADPFFEQFWRDLPLSNSRNTVIRKCEMQLTRAFSSRGYSIGVLYPDREANQKIFDLSQTEAQDVFAYINHELLRFAPFFRDIEKSAYASENWHKELRKFLASDKSLIPFLYLHPHLLIGKCHSAVLKKNRDGYYLAQRREIQRLGLVTELNEEVATELVTWDTNS